MHRLASIAIGLCLTGVCFAQVYQYRDANGRMVYSDTPPPEAGAKETQVRPAAGPASEEARKALAEKTKEFDKRREEAAENQKKADEEAAKKAKADSNCSDARNQLTALESGQRMAKYGKDGEHIVLDDAMRAEETARTRALVDKWCK